jgi:ketosteroid isomerase-like protein
MATDSVDRATDSIDSRVQRSEDADEIRRLIYDYAFHLDMNHPKDLADLFVDDCEVVYGPTFGAEGKVAYEKTLEGIGEFFEATSHHVSNVVIEFHGADDGRSRSVLYAFHRYRKDRPDGHVWGQYHDEFVRRDGKWLFKRRELRAAATQDFHVRDSVPIGRK